MVFPIQQKAWAIVTTMVFPITWILMPMAMVSLTVKKEAVIVMAMASLIC